MKQTATGVVWAQITGKPKTLEGYGITDKVVLTTGSYSDPSWIFSLEWNKIVNAPAFEPALGNPLVDGYILSSTMAGVRSWIAPTTGTGATSSGVVSELPSGAINGANTVFTLSQPFDPDTLSVYLNGLRQRESIDFTVTDLDQFTLTSAPLAGDSLQADYYPT